LPLFGENLFLVGNATIGFEEGLVIAGLTEIRPTDGKPKEKFHHIQDSK
jgi:hypothetical protein